jgi:hypothetical protein
MMSEFVLLYFQQLELKMKLYGLTHDERFPTKKKKKPRRRLCEIDAMVDDLTKNCMAQKQKIDKTFERRQATQESTSTNCSKSNCSANTDSAAKTSLRILINDRISSESTESKNHIKTTRNTVKMETEQTEHSSSTRSKEYAGNRGQRGHEGNDECSAFMQTSRFQGKIGNNNLHFSFPEQTHSLQTEDMEDSHKLSSSAELSLDQCNLLLDLLGTDHLATFQTEAEPDSIPTSLPSPSPSEDRWSSSTPSPVSMATNMLEQLLRKPDGSPTSSETHSLENFTGESF